MTTTARPTRAGRLPAPAAFYLQASIVLFLLASSSAPTPIYSIYQAEWGFTPIVTTVVFGTYAVAVLVSLLTVGSLSDHVGRRPVLLTALSVQAITMLVFASATGVTELLVARGIQGSRRVPRSARSGRPSWISTRTRAPSPTRSEP